MRDKVCPKCIFQPASRQPLQQRQVTQRSGHRSHPKGKRSRAAKSARAVGTYRLSCGSVQGLINGSKTPRNRTAARTEKLFSAEKQKAAQAGALCCLECPSNTSLCLPFRQYHSSPATLCHAACPRAKLGPTGRKKSCYKSQMYTPDYGCEGLLCLFLFVLVCVWCAFPSNETHRVLLDSELSFDSVCQTQAAPHSLSYCPEH